MTWKPGRTVRLDARDYYLRSLGRGDVTPRYLAWANDGEVMKYLNVPPRQVPAQALANDIARSDNKTRFSLGIFARESSLHVGFYTVRIDERNQIAETKVVVGDRDHWGRDVVLQTRLALLDFLFDQAGVFRVVGRPFADNIPMIFNYQRLGFRHEGVLRQAHRKYDGSGRLDQVQFAMLKPEWPEHRAALAERYGP